MPDNSIRMVANTPRDPDLRSPPSGQATAGRGAAVNRRWQDRNSGEWQEATSFFDVICWRELAENVAESLKKGARVVVTGRLEQRSYEAKEGEKRSVVEIIADEVAPSLRWATAKVEKTERKGAGEQGGGGGGYGRSTPVAEPPAYDDFGDEPF